LGWVIKLADKYRAGMDPEDISEKVRHSRYV
jgi:hypothetical protein